MLLYAYIGGCCTNDAKPTTAWNGAWVPEKWSDEYIGEIGDKSNSTIRYDGIYVRPSGQVNDAIDWIQFFPDGYAITRINLTSQPLTMPASPRFADIDYSSHCPIARFSVTPSNAITLQYFGTHERCFHFWYNFGEITPDGTIRLTKQRWLNTDAPSLWGNVAVKINLQFHFVAFADKPPFHSGQVFLNYRSMR
jgi:hypothetical protein